MNKRRTYGDMQTDSVEKVAGVGVIGLWAAMHGWLGWLVVLYAACMMLDCLTGTAQAIKNGEWSSHKARQGLWHKGGSIIMVFVSVLTDILLGLTLNHISGLTLPFNYDMLLTPIVLFWYIVSELGSILENAEKMGAPIPPLLKNVLEKMRDSNNDKNAPSL
jgi:toxin secretion/phage lysis holin